MDVADNECACWVFVYFLLFFKEERKFRETETGSKDTKREFLKTVGSWDEKKIRLIVKNYTGNTDLIQIRETPVISNYFIVFLGSLGILVFIVLARSRKWSTTCFLFSVCWFLAVSVAFYGFLIFISLAFVAQEKFWKFVEKLSDKTSEKFSFLVGYLVLFTHCFPKVSYLG